MNPLGSPGVSRSTVQLSLRVEGFKDPRSGFHYPQSEIISHFNHLLQEIVWESHGIEWPHDLLPFLWLLMHKLLEAQKSCMRLSSTSNSSSNARTLALTTPLSNTKHLRYMSDKMRLKSMLYLKWPKTSKSKMIQKFKTMKGDFWALDDLVELLFASAQAATRTSGT